MLFNNISLIAALAAVVAAQEIDQNDIPQQCTSICAQVVTIARDCDRQNDNNDTAELNCICQAQNANTLFPTCEACVAQFDNDNDDDDNDDDNNDDNNDNDVRDILRRCNFSTTTYNSASASAVASSAASSVAAAQSSALTTVTSGTVVVTTSVPTSSAAGTAGGSTNAAAAPTAAAAVGLGALGLALGML